MTTSDDEQRRVYHMKYAEDATEALIHLSDDERDPAYELALATKGLLHATLANHYQREEELRVAALG